MEILARIIRMNQKTIISLSIFALIFSVATGAQFALAQDGQTDVPPAGSGTQVVVESSSVSVGRIKFRGTILEDVNMVAGTKEKRCRWVNGGFNSGRNADGSLNWFYDPVRAKVCKNPNSPTGWVKVAGGTTGRHCFNPFEFKGPPPKPPLQGPVVMVRSFENLNLKTKAVANAQVKGTRTCPDGAVISGRASGRAASTVRINKQMLIKAKGDTEQLKILIKESILAKAKANAEAKLTLDCGAPVIPEQPPVTPPEQEVTPAVNVVEREGAPPTPPPSQGKGAPTPESLPQAGPSDVIAISGLISMAGTFAYRVTMRRLNLY